jgi:surface carbohydrate biosynthesis protein (TIGR04326 family)
MDIGYLIRQELRGYWITNWAADTLLMTALVRRWAGLGFSFSRFIYIYENQPWERALCWAVRRHFPDADLVGYQHARVPRLLLNFSLAPGGEPEAPLPDRLVTVGKHTAGVLTTIGHEPGRVKVGGALQAQTLLSAQSQERKSPGAQGPPTVLVASSDGLEEAAELVDMAIRLFDEDEGVRVLVKCHPMMPFPLVSSTIGAHLPSNVKASEEPITELIRRSSVMVCSASTVAVEALALGLPVIHLRTQFDLDLDSLDVVPSTRLEATGLKELREKVDWLLDNREEYIAQHRAEWDSFVEEMYGPLTEETYRQFID